MAAIVLLVPLVVDPSGYDTFRRPKELVFHAGGILAAGSAGFLLITNGVRFRREWLLRAPVLLALAAGAWSTIVTITSTNRALSIDSLLWVYSCVVFALTAYAVLAHGSWRWLNVLFLPALINAFLLLIFSAFGRHVLFTRQEMLESRLDLRFFASALVGNPNDVGGYFVVPALAAAAIAVMSTAGQRVLYTAIAGVLTAAITVTLSVAAVGAYIVGIITLIIMAVASRAARVMLIVGCLLAAGLVFAAYPPFHNQAAAAIHALSQDRIDARSIELASSSRLIPLMASLAMFVDHPVTGVGIGCFGWQYYVYKIRVETAYASLLRSSGSFQNYGEAHNDHAQILACSGFPGYLLFAGTLILIASPSFRKKEQVRVGSGDRRGAFAALFGLPLAVSFAALAVAQFPLELAAATATSLFAAALTVAWHQ